MGYEGVIRTGTVLHLDRGPLEAIESGGKTIELRLNDEKRRKIKVGDLLEFVSREDRRRLLVKVIALRVFRDFEELYRNLPLDKCGYRKGEVAEAQDMEKYYSLEDQRKNGVVGIEFEKL